MSQGKTTKSTRKQKNSYVFPEQVLFIYLFIGNVTMVLIEPHRLPVQYRIGFQTL